jgi:tetratricopeptide (TPR) repeat protein
MKDYPAALADITKAIELEPEVGNNYHWRGLTYVEMKDYPAALADFTKAIELQPEDGHNYARRGCIHLATNDVENALADFAKVEALLDKEGRPAYILAGCFAVISQVSEACTWLRRAFERDKTLVSEARTDADFGNIRETQEFGALIAEFEKPEGGGQ